MMIAKEVRADIELIGRRGRQRCHGPVWEGLCPRAASDGTVPCAGGRVLPLRGTWADGAWLTVPAGAGPHCPLAGLVTFVPAPWDDGETWYREHRIRSDVEEVSGVRVLAH